MTCNERIEKTLNRAGQTISDLPRKQEESKLEPYSGGDCQKANGTAWEWYLNIDTDIDDYDSTHSKMVLMFYILHLTDIIDRMETALVNVCGERDYLKYRLNWLSLYTHRDCQSCERVFECDRTPDHCLGWAFGGVPEGWRADDENR